MTVLELAAGIARIIVDVLNGTHRSPEDVARAIIGVGLDAVPVDDLKGYLDNEARRREDLAFELAKAAKYDG